jgi:hypothetical protein
MLTKLLRALPRVPRLDQLDDQRLRNLGFDPDSIRRGMTDRFPPLPELGEKR